MIPERRCVRALIDAHFSGTIAPGEERRMREHLTRCPSCRKYYGRHLVVAKLDPSALGAEARIARGLGLKARKTRIVLQSAVLTGALAAALLVAVPFARTSPGTFTARGLPSTHEAELFAYRANPAQRLADGATIHATDDLEFAYTNPHGYRRLLVYGVDDRLRVYWYFPAWTDPATEPRAISITSGPGLRELSEAIRHDLEGGALTIHAVFLDDDVSVRQVEAMVAASRGPADALPLERAHDEHLTLRVEP